jgi:hypothetical protein
VTDCPGTWLTLFSERWRPSDGVSAFIEPTEKGVVVDDVPEGVVDFFEADVLVVEGLAEEVLPGVQAEGAGPADFAELEVTGVLGWSNALRIQSG